MRITDRLTDKLASKINGYDVKTISINIYEFMRMLDQLFLANAENDQELDEIYKVIKRPFLKFRDMKSKDGRYLLRNQSHGNSAGLLNPDDRCKVLIVDEEQHIFYIYRSVFFGPLTKTVKKRIADYKTGNAACNPIEIIEENDEEDESVHENDYCNNDADSLEVADLKEKIESFKGKIKNKYNYLGKVIYEACKDDETADGREIISEISSFYRQIKELEEEIHALTEKPKCRFCGAEISANAKFCRSCGKKQEAEKVETLNACPRCGYKIDEETVYCENCGMKIERGAGDSTRHSLEESEAKAENKCPYCGENLKDNALFCNACGKKLIS